MDGLKTCTKCQTAMSAENFYRKRNAIEAICKSCKKILRKTCYKQNIDHENLKNQNVILTSTPPKHTSFEPETCSEFSLWEAKYKRPLEDYEKSEIKFNLSALIKVLKESTKDIPK